MSTPSAEYASLCSGIGGLDLAVESVFGYHLAWHAEYADEPASIHERHWPDVANLRDITAIDWTALPSVELLCAGYPCQPFSHAGARRGEEDERHLWPYIAEAVRVLRPRWVVLENVAGHLSLGFGTVLGDLAEAGYDAEWCCVRASDVGAPHGRLRVFILAADTRSGDAERRREPGVVARPGGSAQGEARERQRGGNAASDRGGAAPGSERSGWPRGPRTTGRSQGRRAPTSGSGQDTPSDADVRGREVGGEPDGLPAGRFQASRWADTDGCGAAPANSDSLGPLRGGGSRGGRSGLTDGSVALADPDLKGLEGLEPEGRHVMPAWGDYEPAIRRWETLTRPVPRPTDDRGRLSPDFVEWMMGYPQGWTWGLKRPARLKALGNAVVPQQGAFALSVLLDAWAEKVPVGSHIDRNGD